jgi:uncharacterized membrane protein YhaH (DUF805 family)
MSILFGFAGRIGRLGYCLTSLAVWIVAAALIALIMGFMAPHYPEFGPRDVPTPIVTTAALIVGPLILWFSLALNAKRFRDMGWSPVQAIIAWLAINAFDKLLAMLIPAVALDSGNGTAVGLAINLFMIGSLLFWPSEASVNASICRVFLDMDSHKRRPTAKPDRPPLPVAAAEPMQSPAATARRGLQDTRRRPGRGRPRLLRP